MYRAWTDALSGARRDTIVRMVLFSSIHTPMFVRYCAMMWRTDLLGDPRSATTMLRRQNLKALLAEVRAWLTFADLQSGLATTKSDKRT